MPSSASLSRAAEADLLEIWCYIAEDSFDAADRVLGAIDAQSKKAAENPRIGQPRHDLSPGMRSLVSGSYVIFYRETLGGVTVMRVLHGARDVHNQFPDEI